MNHNTDLPRLPQEHTTSAADITLWRCNWCGYIWYDAYELTPYAWGWFVI
jgi:rubrerythrin